MANLFRKIRSDMFKKKSFLSYLLYAIGEIALIVIGILLALYLQNKNEEKKNKATVITSINMLKDEVLTNKKMIAAVKDYHIMVRDTINTLEPPKNEKEKNDYLSFWSGMRTPRLQNAAFQTTVQSGIGKDFNPKLLKNLNGLYTYQESYNEYTTQALQIFLNTDLTDIKNFKKVMLSVQMTMRDLYFYENELTEMMNYSIKQIDALYPKED